jgi:EAL domain-containing protein (putative c-di-GMP-specific phosphodiesterase class I)
MNGMVRWYIKKAINVLQWGKIILPLSSIRYYPPQFNLRNPVLEGVNAVFKEGNEVAVIVFTIKNMNELADRLGVHRHSQLMRYYKKCFRSLVKDVMDEKNIITMHDFYGDILCLFIKVDYSQHSITDIDSLMKIIAKGIEGNLSDQYPTIKLVLETGYMFVDKKYYSVQEAIIKAQRQAIAMAEKRVTSEFNEMLCLIQQIIVEKSINLLAQPIIDVSTNETRALEMLTRGPKGTLLEFPLQLFSIARQTGLLYDLEMVVFEKALQQIKTSKCHHDIFINFTPITLGNMRITRDIKKMMQKYKGIAPKQIVFEVTERDSIEELKDFNYNIKVLRLMGFRIAVDDTGSGYASLNTISEIMPDIIKIDRSVIENIDKNTLKESMLKGLLMVAKEAGSLVVAEGIENADEASVLTRNNVDLAQGYFYARPTALINGIAT